MYPRHDFKGFRHSRKMEARAEARPRHSDVSSSDAARAIPPPRAAKPSPQPGVCWQAAARRRARPRPGPSLRGLGTDCRPSTRLPSPLTLRGLAVCRPPLRTLQFCRPLACGLVPAALPWAAAPRLRCLDRPSIESSAPGPASALGNERPGDNHASESPASE